MAYTPKLGTLELHARRLNWLPALSATLLQEFPFGVGAADLRTVGAALETLHGIPEHHRETKASTAPANPEQWLKDWANGRACRRQQDTAAALTRHLAAKAA